MNDHIVSSYDQDLQSLHDSVVEMGRAVREMLPDAVKSLSAIDLTLAEEVIKRDKAIDAMQLEIDQAATRVIALRAPVAADLRRIVACYSISNDLERMGDLAKNIAKRARVLKDTPFLREQGKSMVRLSLLVEDMIDDVLVLYADQTEDAAKAIILKDEAVDDLHSSLFREILSYMMEDPQNITALTHYLFITKNIERIGDHVTNIAEQIHYLITGEMLDDVHVNHDTSSSTKGVDKG